jgi:hypothetical protein
MHNICYKLVIYSVNKDEYLSDDEFKFVKSVRYCCNMCASQQTCWTFLGFLVRKVERYLFYLTFN